jgi:hypothetical protein
MSMAKHLLVCAKPWVPSPTLEKKAQVIKTEKKAGFIFVTVS